MEIRKTIQLDKTYDLPKDVRVVNYKNNIIIISPECCNYIVLENKKQFEFYKLLYKNSLGTAMAKIDINSNDVKNVLIQIEAKKFFNDIPLKTVGLLHLHMYLTNACNLRCKHCYMYSGSKLNDELSFNEIVSILDSFSSNDGRFVIFSGGEVLCRNDFFDILEIAFNLKLMVTVMTNGTLWDDDSIKKYSKYISEVQISVDGFNDFENSKVRGVGNFDKAIKAIELFLVNGVRVTVAVTPWYDNDLFYKKDDYINFKHNLQNRFYGYPLNVKFTSDIMDGRDLSLSKKEHDNYFNFMQELSNNEGNNAENLFLYNQKNKIKNDCYCTFGHLSITANGDVFLCGKINMLKPVCNIRDVKIDNIMKLSQKAKKLAKIQNLKPCNNCELMYICGGGCRIDHFVGLKKLGKDVIIGQKEFYRVCNKSEKEYYYDLMIEANNKLFS